MAPDDDPESRISRIDTVWTLVQAARAPEQGNAAAALEEVLRAYSRAIYRYLLGVLRDSHAADEVFQEFALKFVSGRFRRVTPERGRFRDFVKRVLSNLIADYRNRQVRGPAALEDESQVPDRTADAGSDAELVGRWREEVLSRTWSALAREQQAGRQPCHAVLRFRADHPDASSAEMAEQLSTILGRTLNAAGVRQVLHRARERFAELLLDEVARSLAAPDHNALHDELRELDLLPYCQSALARRR